MTNALQYFTRHLFDRDSTEDLELHEVNELLAKYPYFTPARLIRDQLLLKDAESDAASGALYFNNHLWYEYLVHRVPESDVTETSILPEQPRELIPEASVPVDESTQESSSQETSPIAAAVEVPHDQAPIAFEPYHTIDYFASQGIKLAPNDLSKDKFGQQLKSFTEWLRSMKRLPAAEAAVVSDESGQQHVAIAAEHSIEEREVVTEAMAEVWIKQGNRQKAIEVYHKLSLMNSGKSSYFAAKIDELKSN